MNAILTDKMIYKYILNANNYHNDSLVNMYKKMFNQKKIMKQILKTVPEFYKIYIEHYVLCDIYFNDCSINESIVRCWKINLEKTLISHV
jgi:hypothetical protein